jgi:predicted CoA-binding protein
MDVVTDPWSDPRIAERILRSFRTWAVVGASSDPARPSSEIMAYLLDAGYDVIPINPNEDLVHDRRAFPDLRSAASERPGRIEVVDLFRRPDAVLPHVEEAIAIGAKAVWMQLGVWNQEAAELAAHAGLLVVMDRCPKIDHPRLVGRDRT